MRNLLLLSFLLLTSFSFGAVSKKPNTNSLGVVQYNDNPNTYKEGNIVSAAYVEDNGVVVRIQPRGTFALFTEDVLFCAGAAEKLSSKHNPLVLTYGTQAHHTIQGLGCHELRSVDEVKDKKEFE